MPADIKRLRDQLDGQVAVVAQGTWAARPSAGIMGRFYFALDRGLLYYDDGSMWRMFTPEDREAARVVGASGQPPFGAGWSSGVTTDPVAFWRAGSMLFLAGYPFWGSAGWSTAVPIFTLPVGYRPDVDKNVMVLGERYGGDLPPTNITIRADGRVMTAVEQLSMLYLAGVSVPIVR